jgi:hypothetical protein
LAVSYAASRALTKATQLPIIPFWRDGLKIAEPTGRPTGQQRGSPRHITQRPSAAGHGFEGGFDSHQPGRVPGAVSGKTRERSCNTGDMLHCATVLWPSLSSRYHRAQTGCRGTRRETNARARTARRSDSTIANTDSREELPGFTEQASKRLLLEPLSGQIDSNHSYPTP